MRAAELEQKYLSKVRVVGSLVLLPTADAVNLLDDCSTTSVNVLGVETFRLIDGSVQPSMEFSHISFGQVSMDAGVPDVTSFERQPRRGWEVGPELINHCRTLILNGAEQGFEWVEVSLEDPLTKELLFFRTFEEPT